MFLQGDKIEYGKRRKERNSRIEMNNQIDMKEKELNTQREEKGYVGSRL